MIPLDFLKWRQNIEFALGVLEFFHVFVDSNVIFFTLEDLYVKLNYKRYFFKTSRMMR